MQCASRSSASSSTQRSVFDWWGIEGKVEREREEGRGKREEGRESDGSSLFPLPSSLAKIPPVIASPPYGLAAARFPCRALAARAGRAPLGGEREVALACWLAV